MSLNKFRIRDQKRSGVARTTNIDTAKLMQNSNSYFYINEELFSNNIL